jgi:hypothetical protein
VERGDELLGSRGRYLVELYRRQAYCSFGSSCRDHKIATPTDSCDGVYRTRLATARSFHEKVTPCQEFFAIDSLLVNHRFESARDIPLRGRDLTDCR